MDNTGHLDYLAMTFPEEFNPEGIAGYTGEWKVEGSGPHGYQTMMRSELGAICWLHGSSEQGVHVIMSGQPLEAIREENVDDRELVRFISNHSGKASRVDVCVNILNGDTTVDDLWKLWEQKKVRSLSRMAKRYWSLPDEGTDDGFYVGSKHSDKFMRIYNKGRQRGSQQAWVRLELECRKMNARAMVEDLNRKDTTTRTVINRAILEHAEFEDSEYLAALADNNVELASIPHEPAAFWKWMSAQVVPAIATRIEDHPEEQVIAQIRSMLKAEQQKRSRP